MTMQARPGRHGVIRFPFMIAVLLGLSFTAKDQMCTRAIENLRFKLAQNSLQLMQEGKSSFFADIRMICSVFDEALPLGLHALLALLETKSFIRAFALASQLNQVDVEVKVLPFAQWVSYTNPEGDVPAVNTSYDHVHLLGSLWWMRHWAGAFLADALIAGRQIWTPGGSFHDADSLLNHIHQLQKHSGRDQATVSIEHGFIWHSVLSMNCSSYPAWLAIKWCRIPETLEQPCLHAFGHGVFYSFILREYELKRDDQPTDGYSVCNQLRPFSMNISSQVQNIMFSACEAAPSLEAIAFCRAGVHHSIHLMSSASV